MHYSESTGCFYRPSIHGNNLPPDAVAVTIEEHDALLDQKTASQIIAMGPNGKLILVERQAPTVTTEGLCAEIDTAADAARRAVAGDPLRAVEYDRAAAEAQAFKDAGYPADAVPRTVAAWAIGGRTAQQAADNILLESAAYTEALYQIREARLGAKELVRQAMAAGNVDQAQDIAAETIASIESAIAGIGNNA